MKIREIFNYRENKRKKIAADTRSIQEHTAALERNNEIKEKALEAMIKMSGPQMTYNEDLYGTGNQPYASKIWQSSASEARRLSRIAYWEAPPAQAMVGRFVDLVHGPRLELQSSPVWDMLPGAPKSIEERQKFVKNIESRYRLWAKSKKSDYIEDKNHYQRSRQDFENLLIEGEYFEVLRYPATRKRNPLTVQIIGPDNVMRSSSTVNSGNTEVDGIEYNSRGVAVAYHILIGDGSKSKRIPKFGPRSGRQFVIHNKLGNNRRGIGILAGIITELTKLADFQALEIQAAVINALFAMVVETQLGGENKPAFPKSAIGQTNVDSKEATRLNISDYEATLTSTQMQRGGNIMTQLGEGQTLKSLDTKRPTANFEMFYKATLRNLFSAKGMSYDVAMYDPNTSYSAIRTNLLLLWNRVMTLRFDHACDHEDIIYKMWLLGEIEHGNIEMPGFDTDETIQDAWSNATWTGPARPDIDPKKSADAHELESKNSWKTDSQITAERGGGDWDENIQRKETENELKAGVNEPLAVQEKTTYSNNKSESKTESKSIEPGGSE